MKKQLLVHASVHFDGSCIVLRLMVWQHFDKQIIAHTIFSPITNTSHRLISHPLDCMDKVLSGQPRTLY